MVEEHWCWGVHDKAQTGCEMSGGCWNFRCRWGRTGLPQSCGRVGPETLLDEPHQCLGGAVQEVTCVLANLLRKHVPPVCLLDGLGAYYPLPQANPRGHLPLAVWSSDCEACRKSWDHKAAITSLSRHVWVCAFACVPGRCSQSRGRMKPVWKLS